MLEVIFLRTTLTDKLKPRSELEIGNGNCIMKWVSDTPFCVKLLPVTASLKQPPDQQSSKNIMNCLNYDCLRTIFESDDLSLNDLCSIGSVCIYFNAIAAKVFATKYEDEETCTKSIGLQPLWKIEEYFRIAGTITSISSKNFKDDETVGMLISKYCTNLRRMDWQCVGRSHSILEMSSIIANLTHLTLRCSGTIDFTDMLPSNASLEYLQLCDISWNSKLPNVKLPNLLHLTFKNVYPLASIEQFLQLNQNVKTLTIDAYMVYSFGLDRVISYLQNVEEMNIVDESSGGHETNFDALSRLRHLRRVRLHGDTDAMIMRVSRMIIDKGMPLDCLILNNRSGCYPMDDLKQLSTVRCLKIGRLDHRSLEALSIFMCDADEIEIFSELLSLDDILGILPVLKRKKMITFKILCYDSATLCDIDPVQVIEEIAGICLKRGLNVKVIIELDVDCDRCDANEVST